MVGRERGGGGREEGGGVGGREGKVVGWVGVGGGWEGSSSPRTDTMSSLKLHSQNQEIPN